MEILSTQSILIWYVFRKFQLNYKLDLLTQVLSDLVCQKMN